MSFFGINFVFLLTTGNLNIYLRNFQGSQVKTWLYFFLEGKLQYDI